MIPNPYRAVYDWLDDLGGDERGVSEVLGAILLFGLIIMLVVLLQVALVPALNRQAEFEHSQRVQDDFAGFQSGVERVAGTASPETVQLELGVQYAQRAFLNNPPAPAGTLSSSDATVRLTGFEAANAGARDVWNGSPRTYDTENLAYRPNYNEYQNAPSTVYESQLLYNQFEGATRVVNRGSLVSGNRITVLTLDGSVGTSSTSAETFRLSPLSAPMQSVSVSAPAGDTATITVQSRLTPDQWREILADEMVSAGQGGHVASVDPGPTADTVNVSLEGGVEYSLRMGRVGLEDQGTETEPRYVVSPDGGSVDVGADGRAKLVAEARDQYNNGKSNQPITFAAPAGEFQTEGGQSLGAQTTVQTDAQGRATVWYVPVTTPATVTADMGTAPLPDGTPASSPKRVVYTVNTPTGTTTGGTGGGINPGADQGVLHLTDWCSVFEPGQGQNRLSNTKVVQMTFQNDASTPRTISRVRSNFYYTTSPGGGGIDALTYDLTRGELADGNTAGRRIADDSSFGSNYHTVSPAITLSSGTTQSFTLWVSSISANSDDFLIFTIQLSNGDERVYFVPASSSSSC